MASQWVQGVGAGYNSRSREELPVLLLPQMPVALPVLSPCSDGQLSSIDGKLMNESLSLSGCLINCSSTGSAPSACDQLHQQLWASPAAFSLSSCCTSCAYPGSSCINRQQHTQRNTSHAVGCNNRSKSMSLCSLQALLLHQAVQRCICTSLEHRGEADSSGKGFPTSWE